jgi:1-deoxy-D-xylulose-5-phosphate synthase
MVTPCAPIADRLDATLVNMRFVKPLDVELLRRLAATHLAVVTVEENVVAGGAGSAVNEALAAAGLLLPTRNIGLPDSFVEHGTREECLEMAGLDAASLERSIVAFWRSRQPPRVVAAAAGSSAG